MICTLSELITAILGATSGSADAGSLLFRVGVASKRTPRAPHAGGPRSWFPDEDRAIGWPLAGLLDNADNPATKVLIAQIARALLSKADAGQPFERDIVLQFKSPPIGDEIDYKALGEDVKLGQCRILRSELEKAIKDAPQSELAQAEGMPLPDQSLSSPLVQDSLHGALRDVLKDRSQERQDERSRDKDAHTLLLKMLEAERLRVDADRERVNQSALNAAAAEKSRAEADKARAEAEIQEAAARVARAKADKEEAEVKIAQARALGEMASALQVTAKAIANPDPSKGPLAELTRGVLPELKGLINDIRIGAQMHAAQNQRQLAPAEAQQLKALAAAGQTQAGNAAPAPVQTAAPSPVVPDQVASTVAESAPEAPPTPEQQAALRPVLTAVVHGLLRLFAVDQAWSSRPLGDLLNEVDDWPTSKWRKIFVGLDPGALTQIKPEWRGMVLGQLALIVARMAGIEIPGQEQQK